MSDPVVLVDVTGRPLAAPEPVIDSPSEAYLRAEAERARAEEDAAQQNRVERKALGQRHDHRDELLRRIRAEEQATVGVHMSRLYGKPGTDSRRAADQRVDPVEMEKARGDRIADLRRQLAWVEKEIAQLEEVLARRRGAAGAL